MITKVAGQVAIVPVEYEVEDEQDEVEDEQDEGWRTKVPSRQNRSQGMDLL